MIQTIQMQELRIIGSEILKNILQRNFIWLNILDEKPSETHLIITNDFIIIILIENKNNADIFPSPDL